MVQLQHVSFKDWNPIGKPHKKSGDLSSSIKNGTLNDASFNRNNTSINKEPFGEAATLELMHSYVKDESDIKKHNINE